MRSRSARTASAAASCGEGGGAAGAVGGAGSAAAGGVGSAVGAGAGAAAAAATRADPALLKALARAFRYQRLLDEGRYGSVSELAAAERLERGYLGSLLRLTLLAPDIVQSILDGRQPGAVTLPRLLEPFPAAWALQRETLGHH